MPYTPYHVGPRGFLGLLLRRWVDLPVFVLVNVLIDSFYHYDVQIFWPHAKNPFHLWMRKAYRFNQGKLHHDIELVCLVFWGLLIGLYAILIFKKLAKAWKAKA